MLIRLEKAFIQRPERNLMGIFFRFSMKDFDGGNSMIQILKISEYEKLRKIKIKNYFLFKKMSRNNLIRSGNKIFDTENGKVLYDLIC